MVRACAAPRVDGGWDGWCIFLPFGHGLPLVTDCDTIHTTFAGVKSWADAMTTVDLQQVLQRARACWPAALLDPRQRASHEHTPAGGSGSNKQEYGHRQTSEARI